MDDKLRAMLDEIEAQVTNDYPCDRCIYFAGDYHPALCLNPYAKVDKTLRNIVGLVSIDGGKCPGLVEGQPTWQIIFLEEHSTLEDCYRRAREIEAEFEREAPLELIKMSAE